MAADVLDTMDIYGHANVSFPISRDEFQRMFPDNAACSRYLEHLRWPDGFVYPHLPINESKDPEAAETYLPLIHRVFSNLKTWINGTHHGVDEKHLQAYLNEYTFRFNRRFTPFNSFRSLLGLAVATEGPTHDEIYQGAWEHPSCCGVVLTDTMPDETDSHAEG